MTELLLTLVCPAEAAEALEDLLLEHPERVRGFTSVAAAGHGSAVRLTEASQQVSGHAPRQMIQTLGPAEDMRAVLDLLRRQLPHVGIFYWLSPLVDSGRLA